jgi:hypothetical protein
MSLRGIYEVEKRADVRSAVSPTAAAYIENADLGLLLLLTTVGLCPDIIYLTFGQASRSITVTK